MLSVTELKSLLHEHELRLTKRLGQHHLIDERIMQRVVAAGELSETETVVEIGSGLGALTEELARRAGRVIAVEVDKGICALLASRLAPLKNVTVVCEDILEFSWAHVGAAIVVGTIFQMADNVLGLLITGRLVVG